MTVFRKAFRLNTNYPTKLFVSEAHVFYWSHSCIIFISMLLHWREEARERLWTSTAVIGEPPLTCTLLICAGIRVILAKVRRGAVYLNFKGIVMVQLRGASPSWLQSTSTHTHTPLIWALQYLLNPDWVNKPSFCSVIEGCGSESVWCKSSAEEWKHTCLVRLTLRSGAQSKTV